MTFSSDIAPASRVRTLPAGTLDQADLWLMEQDMADHMEAMYDADLPYGPGMEG
jgi:hypothetical protein